MLVTADSNLISFGRLCRSAIDHSTNSGQYVIGTGGHDIIQHAGRGAELSSETRSHCRVVLRRRKYRPHCAFDRAQAYLGARPAHHYRPPPWQRRQYRERDCRPRGAGRLHSAHGRCFDHDQHEPLSKTAVRHPARLCACNPVHQGVQCAGSEPCSEGSEAGGGSPEDFGKFMREEAVKYAKVIRAANLTAQ